MHVKGGKFFSWFFDEFIISNYGEYDGNNIFYLCDAKG